MAGQQLNKIPHQNKQHQLWTPLASALSILGLKAEAFRATQGLQNAIEYCQLACYNGNIEVENVIMQVEIDKFGRLIIPKSVRNHLGIKPGSILELLEQDHEILLRLINQKAPLQRKDGVLVYTAAASDELEDAILKDREDRLKKLFKEGQ